MLGKKDMSSQKRTHTTQRTGNFCPGIVRGLPVAAIGGWGRLSAYKKLIGLLRRRVGHLAQGPFSLLGLGPLTSFVLVSLLRRPCLHGDLAHMRRLIGLFRQLVGYDILAGT